MTRYKLNILLLSTLLLSTVSLSAQHSIPGFSYTLIASRNGIHKMYRPGSRFFLKYKSNSLVQHRRGIFTGVTDGKIVIAANKKGKEEILIAPGDIIQLRKIKPGQRILFAGIGTVLVAGGASLINNGGNTPGSAIRGAIVIPFIGIGAYFLFAVPVTLLLEKLNEKKIADGWEFKLEKK